MGFLLQPAGCIIFIYALKEGLFVRSKNNAAREPARLAELLDNFAPRFAVRFSGSRDCFVLCVIELINGARTIVVQRDGHSNGFVRCRAQRLRDFMRCAV